MLAFLWFVCKAVFWLIIACLVLGLFAALFSPKTQEDAARRRKRASQPAQFSWTYGTRNAMLVCPHCTNKGGVFTKPINAKKGISGGKAVGALMTGGVSLFATGISRKEKQTQAHCETCKSTWHF